MDIEKLWEKAKDKTEVVRGRVRPLDTFRQTEVKYIFLAESVVNIGSTVVRKGKIVVEKPMIILPQDMPQFEGFDFEEGMDVSPELVQMFFLMRGVRFPSLKYNNTVYDLDLEDKSLAKVAKKYKMRLEKKEDMLTALILGPEESWQFSLLFYMAALVSRCAKSDIMKLFNAASGEE